MYHSPVLLPQVLNFLRPQPGKVYIDATVGNGGHTIEIIKQGGTVYGIDQDPTNLQITSNRLAELQLQSSFHPIHANFSSLKAIVQQHIHQPVSGILFDLGLSSNQQISTDRGFSFNDPTSLDMRLDSNSAAPTAEALINTYSFEQLYQIFTKYAQEKLSRPLIYQIINHRQKKPIKSALELANLIRGYFQKHHIKSHLDPATKIFLALRIAVNNEIHQLQQGLGQAATILPPKAIVCVITFNSTEDRTVKLFAKAHPTLISSLTPKAITPNPIEISQNPLSRSAKLRAFVIK